MMYENEQITERVILLAVRINSEEETRECLDELSELAETAGAYTVGRVVQNRGAIDPATYIGSGKIEEVREMLYETDATGVICDDELSPAQLNHLEQELDCKVMDRTLVILDIFANHAVTSEGKIQVELAQLRYRMARLTGLGNSLSRLGGGIGTRGPGEKKLEMDRRLIKERISHLKQELEQVKSHQQQIRFSKNRQEQKVAAIVGYTNAGKSSLLNALTGSNVLQEDKLFATLDPVTRLLTLSGKQQILLTDTVGFIRKLPHHLIEAFRSTLEEARYADILIHVVDASNPRFSMQMAVVYDTLKQLHVEEKPVITLFNKMDMVVEDAILRDFHADETMKISVKKGWGLDEVKEALERTLKNGQVYLEKVYPYTDAGTIQTIRKKGHLVSEEYLSEGIAIKAYVPREVYGKVT